MEFSESDKAKRWDAFLGDPIFKTAMIQWTSKGRKGPIPVPGKTVLSKGNEEPAANPLPEPGAMDLTVGASKRTAGEIDDDEVTPKEGVTESASTSPAVAKAKPAPKAVNGNEAPSETVSFPEDLENVYESKPPILSGAEGEANKQNWDLVRKVENSSG